MSEYPIPRYLRGLIQRLRWHGPWGILRCRYTDWKVRAPRKKQVEAIKDEPDDIYARIEKGWARAQKFAFCVHCGETGGCDIWYVEGWAHKVCYERALPDDVRFKPEDGI